MQMVGNLGLPGWLAYFSAAAEFFGGFLIIAGLWTRFAAATILIDMMVAIAKVHWKKRSARQRWVSVSAYTSGYCFRTYLLWSGANRSGWHS